MFPPGENFNALKTSLPHSAKNWSLLQNSATLFSFVIMPWPRWAALCSRPEEQPCFLFVFLNAQNKHGNVMTFCREAELSQRTLSSMPCSSHWRFLPAFNGDAFQMILKSASGCWYNLWQNTGPFAKEESVFLYVPSCAEFPQDSFLYCLSYLLCFALHISWFLV